MKKRKKVAIILAYLLNNLGDDLFVEHLCLRYPNVDFYIMENNIKNETFDKLNNLYFSKEMKKFFKEFELPNVSKKAKQFYNSFDACVMIGGSIFMQHNQNWYGKLRSFKNRSTINKNTYILGANFGPFIDSRFLIEFGWAFTKVKDLCFRDSFSASYFPDAKNIRYAPDILFSYKFKKIEQKNHIVISVISCGCPGRPPIQINKLKPHGEEYIEKMVEICSEIARKGIKVSLLSFCDRQGDLNVAKIIETKCLRNGVTDIEVFPYTGDANILLNEIASAKAVIATRFHAMILGFLFGKAVYPIIYDEKQKYVLQDLNFFGESTPLEQIAEVDAKQIVECLLDSNSKNSYKAIKPAIERAIVGAEQQFAALDEILKGDGD